MKIVIIGSGVIGSGIARELSRYNCDITVLERGNDVSVGTSKANSGIVHAGFDAHANSNKAKYNVKGNAMFDELSRELDFPFRRNGSLVLCFDEKDLSKLETLRDQGVKNGVPNIEILNAEQVLALEPHVNKDVKGALHAKTGGIVSPYEMNIAYAENAATNGAKFEFLCKVIDIKRTSNGFTVVCENGKTFDADVVVNAAGVHADEINNIVSNNKLHIVARKGDYVLLDKAVGYLADRTLFQLPNAMGKGTLVTPTTHGNILVGPTAVDKDDKDIVATEIAQLNDLFDKALITMPELSKRNIITQFSGLRAHSDTDDFIIGESDVAGFYNVAGIESPGLSSAPAISVDVASSIANKYNLTANTNFVARRRAIPCFAHMTATERQKLVDTNPAYGRIVCRCEVVTEGEIVESLRRPVGAKDLDGVKRRTRAGMGRCQMGFCTPRIMEIIARELNIDLTEVTKCGGDSEVVSGRTK